MTQSAHAKSKVTATVTDVLPSLGLAYLAGDDRRAWTVTKSTPGVGLHSLQPGKRLALTVTHHASFSLVSEYAALD